MILLLVIFGALLHASYNEGVTWLEAQVNAGTLDSNISKIEQASSETYTSLSTIGSSVDFSNLRNRVLVDQNTTEMLSRKILIDNSSESIQKLKTKLLSFKNFDGGFGELSGFNSTIIDTAFALRGLEQNPENLATSITYLISHQNSNGSWSDGKNNPSIYVTALAMHSLWLHRKNFNVQTRLIAAKNYILSQKSSNNLWDEPYLSALALLAITPTYTDNTSLLPSLDALYAVQNTNGSWENDTYTTALVLQAIAIASKKVPNPDLGSISGTILDSSSGLALSGVSVHLVGQDENRTIFTDNSGRFLLNGLSNGKYTIDFSKNDFTSLQTQIDFNTNNIDLGDVLLDTSSASTTTAIKGIVKDSSTQLPIANVTVTVGTTTVTTNADGEYYISDIAAGTVTIKFEADGYLLNQKTIDIQSGYTVMYSAPLISIDSINSDIKAIATGSVISAETSEYLHDVIVVLKNENSVIQTLQTNEQGYFKTTSLQAGNYTILFEKDGYRSVQGSFSVSATQTISFGVIELKVDDPTQNPLTTIQGVISDTITKIPIADVMISVNGVNTLSGGDGSYLLENVPAGDVVVYISKSGYRDLNQSVSLSAGSTLIFSPTLQPINQGSLKLYGAILDANTSEPLSDVNITVQGSTEASVYTDILGNYIIESLNSGDITIIMTKDGYESIMLNTTVSDNNIEFSPSMQKKITSSTSTIRGEVLNITTNEYLSNVSIFINDVSSGIKTDVNGSFMLSDLNLSDANVKLKCDGYKDIEILIAFAEPQYIDLGQLKMRPITAADFRPDLLAEMINTSNVVHNPQTLSISGDINITLANRGTVVAQPFEVIAYFDIDADGNYTKGIDEVIANHSFEESLAPEAISSINLSLNTTAHFRDQPIYVYVDAKNENIELNEENNLYSTAKSCGGKQGSIDLAVCFDYSGSVGGLANMQKNGLISALRDPEKFPRDGSIRLTIMTATNTTYLQPTIITQTNADTVADSLAGRYFSGNSYVDDCLRYAADKLANIDNQSSYKAITLSGDGYWGSSLAYDRDYAVGKGVDVIDALAVGGSINWTTLNMLVYPQPAGGEYGVVTRATSAEEVSNSLVRAFQKQTKVSDLTIGKLEVIDNGTDQNISVKFIIGNAGVAVIQEGLEIAIYEGNPKENGVLLTTTTLDNNLSFGMSTEIQVDNIALQEGGSIYVVGDSQNNLVECTKENNVINSVISATTTLGKITPHANKSNYSADENVSLSANIINPGRLSYELIAQLILEDAHGSVVHTFNPHTLGVVASQEIKTINEEWNTGITLAGEYRLKGILYDTNNNIIDEAYSSFTIGSGTTVDASLRLQTDRTTYHTTDTIEMENLVHNLTTNSILPASVLHLTISDSTLQIVYDEAITLNQLAPQGMQELIENFSYSSLHLGDYIVDASLRDAQGNTLAHDSQSVHVQTDTIRSLAGIIEADASSVEAGTPVSCATTIQNISSEALGIQAFRELLVGLDTNTILNDIAYDLNVTTDTNVTRLNTFNTNGFETGIYACSLQALINGEWSTLDYASFNVTKPPIEIDHNLTIGTKGRLLVLLDKAEQKGHCHYGCKHEHNNKYCMQSKQNLDYTEPYGPKEALGLDVQRAYLEKLLTDNHYAYTIVESADAFETEFRSGNYNAYALLQERIKLSEQLLSELQEASYRGEGLLVMGMHDKRNSRLSDALGIMMKSATMKTEKLEMIEDAPFNSLITTLSLKDPKYKVQLKEAQLLGTFSEEKHKNNLLWNLYDKYNSKGCASKTNEGAVTRNIYYKGKAVFVGFDLLIYAAKQTDSEYEELLLTLLQELQPDNFTLNSDDVVPLHLELINRGVATPGKTNTQIYNSDAKIVDAGNGTFDVDNSLIWNFMLEENNTSALDFWIKLPSYATYVELQTDIYTGENNNSIFYESFAQGFDVVETKTLNQVIENVNNLKVCGMKIIAYSLDKAKRYEERGKYDEALRLLLSASKHLSTLHDEEAKSLRYDIALIIKTISKKVK